MVVKDEATDKVKDGTTEPAQNPGAQQGSLQQTAEAVQLPRLAEASRKPEAVVKPEEPKVSTRQSKNSSPKNPRLLPPIM